MTGKILVVSDTHGRRDNLRRCIDISAPFDIIIHCGDGIKDIRSADIPEKTTVLAVTGNTDLYSSPGEESIIFEKLRGKNVLITHGHLYNVKSGLFALQKFANETAADVVLFGHTHQSFLSTNNPVLFNPGDLSTGSYGIIIIGDDKEWTFEQKKIKY